MSQVAHPAANVANKHILITGGASGIGKACALLLAERGATVGVADLHLGKCDDVVAQIRDAGGEAYAVEVDVREKEKVSAMFDHAINQAGQLDVLINNAGIDHIPAPMHEVPDEAFLNNISVNLTGVWYCMKTSIQLMLANGGGHIINIASVAGLRSAPSVSAYSAAKHGVIGLTKSAAAEYAKANIRVNAVCPSFIDTPMVQGVLNLLPEKKQQDIVRANPMKRLGTTEEIAGAVAWMCSDESSFMTGNSMILDGGMLA